MRGYLSSPPEQSEAEWRGAFFTLSSFSTPTNAITMAFRSLNIESDEGNNNKFYFPPTSNACIYQSLDPYNSKTQHENGNKNESLLIPAVQHDYIYHRINFKNKMDLRLT